MSLAAEIPSTVKRPSRGRQQPMPEMEAGASSEVPVSQQRESGLLGKHSGPQPPLRGESGRGLGSLGAHTTHLPAHECVSKG